MFRRLFVQHSNSDRRFTLLCASMVVSVGLFGCSSSSSTGQPGSGGASSGGKTGSGGSTSSGGASGTGGATAGATTGSGGSAALGGSTASGGKNGSGGAATTGGSSSGGQSGLGGAASGGAGTTGSGGSAGGRGGTTGTTGGGGSAGGSGGTTGSTGAGGSTSVGSLPGDIAKAAGTPMVAAHSMTRAMFASYTGPLFKAQRTSDGQGQDIGTVAGSGLVDTSALNTFCSGGCQVATIYAQTDNKNDMWKGDTAANAPMDNGETPKLCHLLDIQYWQMT